MDKRKRLSETLKEIKNLKKHATPEELDKLDFESLNPGWPRLCIYGQMTGDCFSGRANELTDRCSHAIFALTDWTLERGDYSLRFFTYLECYITHCPKPQLKIIVDYLKGDREKITVKDLDFDM